MRTAGAPSSGTSGTSRPASATTCNMLLHNQDAARSAVQLHTSHNSSPARPCCLRTRGARLLGLAAELVQPARHDGVVVCEHDKRGLDRCAGLPHHSQHLGCRSGNAECRFRPPQACGQVQTALATRHCSTHRSQQHQAWATRTAHLVKRGALLAAAGSCKPSSPAHTLSIVVPCCSARVAAAWMVAPSASGSEYGTPSSITSAPICGAGAGEQ